MTCTQIFSLNNIFFILKTSVTFLKMSFTFLKMSFTFLNVYNNFYGRSELAAAVILILSNPYNSPERDSNLGLREIALFEDCEATALTTQPLRLDNSNSSQFCRFYTFCILYIFTFQLNAQWTFRRK